MAFKFENVVPWGRSYDEYCGMFDLTAKELKKRILGCADGPASFNSICNKSNGNVISIDPIYSLTKEQILDRIRVTYDDMIEQAKKNQDKFKWEIIKSVDELGRIRMKAMNHFLETYEKGRKDGKYIKGSLPNLPFEDNSFGIALSSHFLFLYSDNLSYDFHYKAINEMLRVANEVRIFPLLDVNAKKSVYVDKIRSDLCQFNIDIRKVDYEFQIDGNELMIISKGNGKS